MDGLTNISLSGAPSRANKKADKEMRNYETLFYFVTLQSMKFIKCKNTFAMYWVHH